MDERDFSRSDDGDETASESVTRTRGPNEPPSWTVIEAVSEATETEPERLRPLYESVDPDALDAMFGSIDDRDDAAERVRVAFRYEGCDVVVYGDGRTVVSPAESTDGGR